MHGAAKTKDKRSFKVCTHISWWIVMIERWGKSLIFGARSKTSRRVTREIIFKSLKKERWEEIAKALSSWCHKTQCITWRKLRNSVKREKVWEKVSNWVISRASKKRIQTLITLVVMKRKRRKRKLTHRTSQTSNSFLWYDRIISKSLLHLSNPATRDKQAVKLS